jgi:hypothetical protein
MSNRTLAFLTALVILGMLILFALNMTDILTGKPPNQVYLKYHDVRGMAVGHHRLHYTLNFKQQNTVIDILNSAVPITEIKSHNREPANIDTLIIYQFQNMPDVVLTPIAYIDQNLVFSAPKWVPNGYLMELSEGDLKKLLSQTYD